MPTQTKVPEELLAKADCSKDKTARALVAYHREQAALDLNGRAYHQRNNLLKAIERALRKHVYGGEPAGMAAESEGVTLPNGG